MRNWTSLVGVCDAGDTFSLWTDVPHKTGPVRFGRSLSAEQLDDFSHQFGTSEHPSTTDASRMFYVWVGDAILGTLPAKPVDKLWSEAWCWVIWSHWLTHRLTCYYDNKAPTWKPLQVTSTRSQAVKSRVFLWPPGLGRSLSQHWGGGRTSPSCFSRWRRLPGGSNLRPSGGGCA